MAIVFTASNASDALALISLLNDQGHTISLNIGAATEPTRSLTPTRSPAKPAPVCPSDRARRAWVTRRANTELVGNSYKRNNGGSQHCSSTVVAEPFDYEVAAQRRIATMMERYGTANTRVVNRTPAQIAESKRKQSERMKALWAKRKADAARHKRTCHSTGGAIAQTKYFVGTASR
jgi:hypothetical protein